jgi:endonuclease-8
MPEGDSIDRHFVRLRPALEGARVESAWARVLPAERWLPGRTVLRVSRRAKHLLLDIDDATTLHIHLGLGGGWTGPRDPAWRPSVGPRLALFMATARGAVACWAAPVVERLHTADLLRHPVLGALGPDVLDGLDVAEVVRRAFGTPDRPIGEALLDQRVLGGVGNIWRAEILFEAGVHPATTTGRLGAEGVAAVVARAGALMEAGRAQGRPGLAGRPGATWVYGRTGRPCRRCGAGVEVGTLVPGGRRTWWCPRCQPMTPPT